MRVLRKHFWWDRKKFILDMLKEKSLLTTEIHRALPSHYDCKSDDLHHILIGLVKLKCVKRAKQKKDTKWVYLKDIDPLPKTKKELEDEENTVPQSVWINWESVPTKKIIVQEETKEPRYERKESDIKNGIYRAEDRKGRWQQDAPKRINHGIGGNMFNVGVW